MSFRRQDTGLDRIEISKTDGTLTIFRGREDHSVCAVALSRGPMAQPTIIRVSASKANQSQACCALLPTNDHSSSHSALVCVFLSRNIRYLRLCRIFGIHIILVTPQQ